METIWWHHEMETFFCVTGPLWGESTGHRWIHYDDVIMGAMSSQITSLMIVYSTVYSGADQRKHQSSASLAFVRGIHRGPVNSPHKWPVARKMFPFDDVIMSSHKGQWRGALVFSLRLNKRLTKQSWCRWFETPSRSLWRHCNDFAHFLHGSAAIRRTNLYTFGAVLVMQMCLVR